VGQFIAIGGGTAAAAAPLAHASTHQHGGTDEVAVAVPAANAIPKALASRQLDPGWIPAAASGGSRHWGENATFTDLGDGEELNGSIGGLTALNISAGTIDPLADIVGHIYDVGTRADAVLWQPEKNASPAGLYLDSVPGPAEQYILAGWIAQPGRGDNSTTRPVQAGLAITSQAQTDITDTTANRIRVQVGNINEANQMEAINTVRATVGVLSLGRRRW